MVAATTTTKTKIRPQKVILKSFEDSVHYQTSLSFQYRGMEVGAYLLKSTPKSPFTLVFGFECAGIHSFLADDKLSKTFDVLEAGLKDLPARERLTFHLGAYKSDSPRQQHLDELISLAPNDEIRFLLAGEKARIRQLSVEGLREPKTLQIFVTYRADKAGQHQDWLDIALSKLEQAWQKYSSQSNRIQRVGVERLLRRAWGDGFIHWKQVLENKLELLVRPLRAQEMWNYIWGRLNHRTPPIDLPQCVTVARSQVSEEINSQVHGSTLLLADSEPVFDRQWVRLGDKYVGVLTFWDKPGGWNSKRQQLHYLWQLVAKDLVTDTEIITQIVPANQKKINWLVSQVTKQSIAKAKNREQHNESDMASKMKARGGEQAQEKLISGEIPFL
ncbi:MAG: hypothetical protein HC763_29175, partial [Hydrococcus sp. CRU_1_1]|nr:hypothetical protein [Hydrococcus sp. CRU_1_1]